MKFEVQIGERTLRLDTEALPADVVTVAPGTLSLLVEGRSYLLHWRQLERGGGAVSLWLAGPGGEFTAEVRDPRRLASNRHFQQTGRVKLKAPMAGKVVRVLAAAGEAVKAGQGVLVLEAMKMQNEVRSPKSGVMASLAVEAGQTVATGQLLAEIE